MYQSSVKAELFSCAADLDALKIYNDTIINENINENLELSISEI